MEKTSATDQPDTSPGAAEGVPDVASAEAEYGARPGDLESLHSYLVELRRALVDAERDFSDRITTLPADRQGSARNLVHYLALRGRDLRALQVSLTEAGLSSLGRSETHVLASVEAVVRMLERGTTITDSTSQGTSDAVSPEQSWRLLESNALSLLGSAPQGRGVRIMVTMPSEAASDFDLVREFVSSGMDCMRINCAHDGPDAWSSMILNLRRAETELGRECRVLMDLPGPRVRTGPIQAGPAVIKIEPQYDDLGRVAIPGRVWLTNAQDPVEPPEEGETVLPVPAAFLRDLTPGDRIVVRDPTAVERTLMVEERTTSGAWARVGETVHIETGARLFRNGEGEGATVGPLPERKQKLILRPGDTLILTRGDEPGRPAREHPESGESDPARIGCIPPHALDHVRPNERIWLDDGRIGGVVRAAGEDVVVEITRTRPGGDKLKSEKGINLPDSDLRLPPLGKDDLELLPFIAEHADMVGYSFVGAAQHVAELRSALAEVGADGLGIVLKIERNVAFRELPQLLLEGMRHPVLGVMIARGDLAVECGFARMAEIQEEILWICSAAHVPVIWATEVMDRLAKLGRPSRAEVTDAAMGGRAECIMLNKGPHIPDAVRALNSILVRMQEHQQKKRSMLRKLEVASHFLDSGS